MTMTILYLYAMLYFIGECVKELPFWIYQQVAAELNQEIFYVQNRRF